MTSFFKIPFLFSCLTLLSCEKKIKDSLKEEPPKEEWQIRNEKQKQLDSLNKNEASNLTLRFNAISGNDSSIKFTYQLQEIVKENIKLISFTGNINDITQKDSSFILKIYGKFSMRRCFGKILVSPEIFQKIHSQLNLKSSFNGGCFIFKPSSIKSSSMLTINTELHTNQYAETVEDANASAEAELTYNFKEGLLFFEGSIVDFYLYKKLPEDND